MERNNEQKEQGKKQSKEKVQHFEIEYVVDKKKHVKKESYKDKKDEINYLKNKVKAKEKEINELKKNIQRLKEELLRQMADKDNFRKRIEREKNEFYQYALVNIIKDLLPVLDNFERALKSTEDDNSASIREGINMIYNQFLDLLVKQGLKPIKIIDKKFDPNLHQAFLTEESNNVKEIEISEELQRGYMFNDRLLRPTLVKVVVPKKERN
ncbi:MAG: nucleotide exchange factor GrpE [Candidatus Aminicenantes bacterium]|nr:nucleotide exchange factor GrpE [Candidatus Aminicenantes bacterium]